VRPSTKRTRPIVSMSIETRLEETNPRKSDTPRRARPAGLANGDNVPSVGRNLVVGEVTLEGARLAALCPIEIEAEIGRRFDPRHDTRDVVKVEIATGPQTVDHLFGATSYRTWHTTQMITSDGRATNPRPAAKPASDTSAVPSSLAAPRASSRDAVRSESLRRHSSIHGDIMPLRARPPGAPAADRPVGARRRAPDGLPR